MRFAVHRVVRPILAAATVGALCFGSAACAGDDSPTVAPPRGTSGTSPSGTSGSASGPPPSSSRSGANTPSGDPVEADFRAGQCYDDSVQLTLTPCDQGHELEITAVVKTGRHSGDIVRRAILRTWTCNDVVSGYLGSSTAAFSLVFGQPVPSAVDPAAATEIVCAAGVSKPDDSGYQEISYRLRNRIKDKGYVSYRICTSDRPSQDDSPAIVPCSRPHQAETIGGFVIGTADGRYPGAEAVDRTALQRCVPLAEKYLGTTRADVIAAANSTGRSGWQGGTTMTACFVEATTGTFRKPLQGMQNQPLSKFQ